MNTIGDTNEGKARPSVWPVYLAAAGLVYTSFCVIVSTIRIGPVAPGGWLGLLGFLTAWGLGRLRAWGWWCAVVWTSVFTALFGLSAGGAILHLILDLHSNGLSALSSVHPDFMLLWVYLRLVELTVIVLLVWVIATRRQLFFPPKQGGEG